MSEDKVKRKSFFTPCRSVGLKRRSTGTPSPAQNSPKNLLLAGESAGSNCTPKRVEAKFRKKPLCRLPKTLKTFAAEDENKETSVVQTSATKDENGGTSVVEDLNCTVDTKQIESSPLDLEKQITEVELRLNQLKNDIQSLESISLNAKQVRCKSIQFTSLENISDLDPVIMIVKGLSYSNLQKNF